MPTYINWFLGPSFYSLHAALISAIAFSTHIHSQTNSNILPDLFVNTNTMPPKAADKGDKMFSADVVAAVLYSTGTTSLSKKNYEMMSALDGKKSACGFQHDFRSVIAKAKELKARVDGGKVFKPVPSSAKRGK
jgi:hypothetical protein